MKKVGIALLLLMLSGFCLSKTDAMTFEEGFSQAKPMALLVYADWADDAQKAFQAFTQLGQNPAYAGKYNFITMDIASKDAKAFNQIYHIYPGLPYVLLFKDRGRVSRYLKKDCILDNSCFADKLGLFVN